VPDDLLQRFSTLGEDRGGQQVLDPYRQFAHANARCVVDPGRDGGRDAGQADLADAASAKFIDFFIGEVEEMHVDRRNVGVDRHHVVRQVTVDRRAALQVVRGVL
jgi:hypothetical protein